MVQTWSDIKAFIETLTPEQLEQPAYLFQITSAGIVMHSVDEFDFTSMPEMSIPRLISYDPNNSTLFF